MADAPRHPLLNPVLRFTKDPKPEGISGGGKNAHGIKAERLGEQRRALALPPSASPGRTGSTTRCQASRPA